MTRTLVLLATLLAGTVPAYADDTAKGVRIDAGYAGSITGSSALAGAAGTGRAGPPTGYDLTGHCEFAGVLAPDNRLRVGYGGTVVATGPQLPELSYVRCDVTNAAGETDFCEVAAGGPASACADLTDPWRVSPVGVCVSGFAVFGPTPVVRIDLPRTCGSILN